MNSDALGAEGRGHDTRVLVVDDEWGVRTPIVRGLGLMGYQVAEAASGEEALVLIAENKYDVMLLDLTMSVVSGEEVMERAHEMQPELMIVILTGQPSLQSAISAIQVEAVDYLLKPATMSQIVNAINQAMEKRRENRQKIEQAVSAALDQIEEPATSEQPLPNEKLHMRPVLLVEPLILNRSHQYVKWSQDAGREVELTKGESDVLYWLMMHRDLPLSCRQLVNLCWKYDLEKEEAQNIIRPYISRLRQKLEEDPRQPKLIRTIRKRGYLFQSAA